MPVVDARRMEVYRGIYTKELHAVQQPEAAIIDDSFYGIGGKTVGIFGEGAEKCASSLPPNYVIIEAIYPSAAMMVSRAHQYFKDNKFEDVAYFEPFYLKEFITGVSGKKI
jgi:tRNA threonylcarbamoyladenosine biosynthesis protein TsaB